jgi:hypothetical protein
MHCEELSRGGCCAPDLAGRGAPDAGARAGVERCIPPRVGCGRGRGDAGDDAGRRALSLLVAGPPPPLSCSAAGSPPGVSAPSLERRADLHDLARRLARGGPLARHQRRPAVSYHGDDRLHQSCARVRATSVGQWPAALQFRRRAARAAGAALAAGGSAGAKLPGATGVAGFRQTPMTADSAGWESAGAEWRSAPPGRSTLLPGAARRKRAPGGPADRNPGACHFGGRPRENDIQLLRTVVLQSHASTPAAPV